MKQRIKNFIVFIVFIIIVAIFGVESIPVLATIVALATGIKTQRWEIIFITVAVWAGIGIVWLLSKRPGIFQIPVAAALVFGVPYVLYWVYDNFERLVRWFERITGHRK